MTKIKRKSGEPIYEIGVVGGGLTGVMTAIALSFSFQKKNKDTNIVLINRGSHSENKSKSSKSEITDRRTTTINAAGKTMLEVLGIWSKCSARSTPINKILVGGNGQSKDPERNLLKPNFELEWQDQKKPMAFVVENVVLLDALYDVIKTRPVKLLEGADIIEFDATDPNGFDDVSTLHLADLTKVYCRLVVACDGSNSKLRELSGIKWRMDHHRQNALVTNVSTQFNHENTAFQRFLPGGPIALMPHGKKEASMVWTLPINDAERLSKLEDKELGLVLNEAFGNKLGSLNPIGQRYIWPIVPGITNSLTSKNLVFAGDSGHTLHPLAGQGYNLALGDAAVLADSIARATSLGLHANHRSVLNSYSYGREIEVRAMKLMTSFLNEIMSFQPNFSRFASLGMKLLNSSPIMKPLQKVASGGHLTDASLLNGRLPHSTDRADL